MDFLRDAAINSPLLLGGFIGAVVAAIVIFIAEQRRR